VKSHLIWSVTKWNKVKWSERSEVKWNEVKFSIGKGGERVFTEKAYTRSSKWWEVKDWGESVSELIIKKKNNYNKLNTVLSYLGIFTFCTCCIVICLACIVVSFKLSCVYCCRCLACTVVILCVFVVLCVYCCFLLYMPDCWLEVSNRKVPRPATSTHVFLGFPVSISKCWDGSQHSKMPLHASRVALPTYISNQFHILYTCKITTATGWPPNCS